MATPNRHASTSSQQEIFEEENPHSSIIHQPNPITSEPLVHYKTTEIMSFYEMKAKELEKLMEDDLRFIDEASENLKKYRADVENEQNRAKEILKFKDIPQWFFTKRFLDDKYIHERLADVKKHIMKMKTEIPSKVKVRLSEPTATDAKPKKEILSHSAMRIKDVLLAEVPSFYKKNKFESSEIFKEFEASFKHLDHQHQQCLLCFALFPENATVKKRLLMYWWIGEGFIYSDEWQEASAEDVLNKLMSGNFIEPVYDKCPFKIKAHSFKLQPLAHAAVIMLAERKNFFDFDDNGNPTREHIRSGRSCLLKEKKQETKESYGRGYKNNSVTKYCFPVLALKSGSNTQTSSEKPMGHVVFNLSETFLRLKREWFTQMKLINVLYLGRWDSTSKRHIEVEDTKDLEGLADLKYVKFLSLQGISGIAEIPDSISKLWNLRILDLRACHNLEAIPEGIGSLKYLTYLDISECYLLTGLPKGLKALRNLVVLKGFQVQDTTDSCSLKDLSQMTRLRKLSVHTEIEKFPTEDDLLVLETFKQLRILTIEWEANSDSSKKEKMIASDRIKNLLSLPSAIEKLDLRWFPRRRTPGWLKPNKLQNLKKLYIRGGELLDLGQFPWFNNSKGEDTETYVWNAKILRLKYLTKMEMDWMELRELFPKLKYLQKVKCPKLTMFPCNAHGVWKNKKTTF